MSSKIEKITNTNKLHKFLKKLLVDTIKPSHRHNVWIFGGIIREWYSDSNVNDYLANGGDIDIIVTGSKNKIPLNVLTSQVSNLKEVKIGYENCTPFFNHRSLEIKCSQDVFSKISIDITDLRDDTSVIGTMTNPTASINVLAINLQTGELVSRSEDISVENAIKDIKSRSYSILNSVSLFSMDGSIDKYIWRTSVTRWAYLFSKSYSPNKDASSFILHNADTDKVYKCSLSTDVDFVNHIIDKSNVTEQYTAGELLDLLCPLSGKFSSISKWLNITMYNKYSRIIDKCISEEDLISLLILPTKYRNFDNITKSVAATIISSVGNVVVSKEPITEVSLVDELFEKLKELIECSRSDPMLVNRRRIDKYKNRNLAKNLLDVDTFLRNHTLVHDHGKLTSLKKAFNRDLKKARKSKTFKADTYLETFRNGFNKLFSKCVTECPDVSIYLEISCRLATIFNQIVLSPLTRVLTIRNNVSDGWISENEREDTSMYIYSRSIISHYAYVFEKLLEYETLYGSLLSMDKFSQLFRKIVNENINNHSNADTYKAILASFRKN